tara:strand:- start:1345 stop:1614 length:270 start_codon:yes stop_codon:yes gene_type:complete
MTKKRALKLLESLGNSLEKEKGLEDAASVIYVLAGTVALDNKEALSSLCHHNATWAAEALRIVQENQKNETASPPSNETTPPPLILPDK